MYVSYSTVVQQICVDCSIRVLSHTLTYIKSYQETSKTLLGFILISYARKLTSGSMKGKIL